MATEGAKESLKTTPPYVPFKTFLSSLDILKNGIPNQIDRSVFPSMAGVSQSQVLQAFRFFGLISADGKPTAELSKAVDDKERQAQVKKLLEKGYPHLFALGLANASPNSLDAELRKSGLTGDTHEKAKSFFLQAAKYAGVTLSPYLLKVTRVSTPRKKRQVVSKPGGESPQSGARVAAGGSPQAAPMKTMQLAGGIELFLGASADLFGMASEDRKFVLELLDRIEQYEQAHPVEEEAAEESTEEEQA